MTSSMTGQEQGDCLIEVDRFYFRPKKNICVFTVTCKKNLGSVGQD
jgi:hypothetical protein